MLKTEHKKLQDDIESCKLETFGKPASNEPMDNDPVENDSNENDPVANDSNDNDPVENVPNENDPVENESNENDLVENDSNESDPVENDSNENDPVDNDSFESKPEQNDQTGNTQDFIENILEQKKSKIMITSLRHTSNGQEIDLCSAIQTDIGYFTSKSCCQADEIGLFDIETDEDIQAEKNSMWFGEHICFISTSDNANYDFPSLTTTSTALCSINAFDEFIGEFKEHQLELNVKKCFGVPCSTEIDLAKNETILNGSSINCQNSSLFGVITKSKSSLRFRADVRR